MNQSKNIKELIINQISKIVFDKKNIISTTIVGSFNDSIGLGGISDIDVVIIVDKLSEKVFNEIILSFQNIDCSEIGLKAYDLIVNSTFGPLKLNSKKSVVFHVMVYDIIGHIKHVEESPFTCHSWEQSEPILGISLKDIYPVLNLQLSDLLESRRGILSYINDIKKGSITYRKYQFENGNPIVIKDLFHLDPRHRLEYSYHISYHLLNNLHKIIVQKKESLSPKKISKFYLDLEPNFKKSIDFFNELSLWKNSGGAKPENIIKKTIFFINQVFLLVEKINLTSISICFKRHQKTEHNDGTFLGSRRNPSIEPMINLLNEPNYKVGYCSHLNRSKETIKHYNCELIVESSYLNEIDYGLAEGLTLKQLSDNFPDMVSCWKKGEDPKFPEGESQRDVLKRVQFFLEFELEPLKDSIVVTHLVVLRMVLYSFLEMNFKDMYKIQIDHLEGYDFLNFKTYFSPILSSSLRSVIRNQLSKVNG